MIYSGSQKYKLYVGSSAMKPIVPLPYYAEVEYLESNGTQYIDLNIIPTSSTGVMAKVESTNNSDTYLLGLRDTTGNTRWCIGHSGNYYYGYGTYNYGILSETAVIAKMNYLNDGIFVVSTFDESSTSTPRTLPSLPFTPVNQIRLFGSSGIVASYTKWSGKIYSVEITEGSNIVMDLIPVRVGQVGYMYDRVSNSLLSNAGSGAFILGNDK